MHAQKKTISIIHVIEAVAAFRTTTLPPMCLAWDALKRAAVESVWTYALENDLTIAQVTEMAK